MPLYYFQITDGRETLKSPFGSDLLGDAAAREEAVRLTREIKDGPVGAGRNWDGWFVRITDAQGREIDAVPIDLAPDEPLPP